MALSTAAITYDVSDQVGTDFDIRRTKIWVSTNIADGTVIDTVGNAIRVDTGQGTLAADGTGTVTVWTPGTGSNPDSWQTYVHLDYASPMDRTRKRRTFGPFTVTTAANLADLVEEQEVPAEYLTTITAALQVLVDDAETAVAEAEAAVAEAEAAEAAAEAAEAAAEAAQAAAEAARDDAIDISGIATPDGVVAALAVNEASATFAAISEGFVRVFTPEAYGAVGNGVADDTAAVRACFTAANALVRAGLTASIKHPGATVVLTGTYALTSIATPIDVMCNVTENRATFVIPDAYAGVAVRVGHATSGSILQSAAIYLPDVIKPLTAGIVAGSVGVRVQNLYSSDLMLGRTAFFETAVHLTGLGQGTVYNRIHLGWISYAKVSLKLVPDTGGWVNQNTFVGGGFQQAPGAFGGGLRRSGWYHLLIDGAGINTVNGNTFLGVSFEGDVSEHTFHIANAYGNQFIGCRFEQGTAGTAVTVAGGGTATLTKVAHGLTVGDMVSFFAASTPGGMVLVSPYFVIAVPTADTFTVAQKKGGTAATFSSTGTTVTYYRPPRIYFDETVTNYWNAISDPGVTPVVPFLELVQTSGGGTGNVVQGADRRVVDAYYLDDLPPFRSRNKASTAGSRPAFAAYPAAVNPIDDPKGWTAALAETGVVFSSGGVQKGVLSQGALGLTFKRPADAVAFDVASCVRSMSTIAISGLSLTASTTTTTTITLTGAAYNDHTTITPVSDLPAGVSIAWARVTGADTIKVAFLNITGSPISLTVNVQAITVRAYY